MDQVRGPRAGASCQPRRPRKWPTHRTYPSSNWHWHLHLHHQLVAQSILLQVFALTFGSPIGSIEVSRNRVFQPDETDHRAPGSKSFVLSDNQHSRMPEASLPKRSVLKRSSSKPSPKSSTSEKTVSFSELEIYEFRIALGDNPSCEGAPLCIAGRCQNQSVQDISTFELNRKARKDRKKLVISPSKRSKL